MPYRLFWSILLLCLIAAQPGKSNGSQQQISDLLREASSPEAIDQLLILLDATPAEETLDHSASYEEVFRRAKKMNYKKGMGAALDYHGTFLMNTGNYEESISKYIQLLDMAQEDAEIYSIERAHILLSSAMTLGGQFENAIFELTQAIKICLDKNNKETLGKAYNNLAAIYARYLRDDELSAHYLEKSVKLQEDNITGRGFVYASANLCLLYLKMKQYQKSEELINKAFDSALLQKDSSLIQYSRLIRGMTYSELGKYDLALSEISDVLAYHKKRGEKLYYAESLESLAQVHRAQGNYALALKADLESMSLLKELDGDVYLPDIFTSIFEDYKGLNKFENALTYFEKAHAIRDSMEDINGNKIRNLIMQFEKEKHHLEEAAANKTVVIRNQRLVFSLILVGVLALLSLLLYSRQKQLRMKDAEIFQLKERQLLSEKKHSSHQIDELELTVNTLQKELASQSDHVQFTNRQKIISSISSITLNTNKDWEEFKRLFNSIEPEFFNRVYKNYEDVTSGELRLMALLKLDLSTERIAEILGISKDGVRKSKYRLRKKMGIEEEKELKQQLSKL